MALTDTRLRTLKPKGRPECLIADGNGLYVRIRKGREGMSRTWQFRRKERGALSITTLGTYPDLSIKEARLKAAELGTKRQSHSPTVQEVADHGWASGSTTRIARPTRSAAMSIGRLFRSWALPGFGTLNQRTSPA